MGFFFFFKDMIHSIQIYSGRQSYVALTYTDQQSKTVELDAFKSSVLDRSKFLKTSSKCYFLVSEYCLAPSQQFFSSIMAKTN